MITPPGVHHSQESNILGIPGSSCCPTLPGVYCSQELITSGRSLLLGVHQSQEYTPGSSSLPVHHSWEFITPGSSSLHSWEFITPGRSLSLLGVHHSQELNIPRSSSVPGINQSWDFITPTPGSSSLPGVHHSWDLIIPATRSLLGQDNSKNRMAPQTRSLP
jgi:hypothetical protein